jgi:putative FmdB family regulatory protein
VPIYEYKCWECGEVFETIQPMSAPKEGTVCPKCGSENTTRIPSSFSGMDKGCSEVGDYGGFT